ncbi:MAG: class I SAM-dependent methyltransferase [Lysobacter sp.]|nr:MAG: class I SAM-dependent methyltransferase [Lysobacter sp.]
MDIRTVAQLCRHRLDRAPADPRWDLPDAPEPKIHRIHGYPAKFPAFLTTKALEYARDQGLRPRRVADVFCGCGTVAQEARRKGLDFWGCDINPVATLIARTKSASLRPARLRRYAGLILQAAPDQSPDVTLAPSAIARLQEWFVPEQYAELARLLNAIRAIVPARSRYRDAFYCAFSAILKSCSQWRQRSIKPTFDHGKRPATVLTAFSTQCELLASAFAEQTGTAARAPEIHLANVLSVEPPPMPVDLIITSPPYVTSYEYADLHQLSSLWLGFADDHRQLRAGSIGSAQHELNLKRTMASLNRTGMQIVFSLYNEDRRAARAVANYYLDMQRVACRCREFLTSSGMAVFVIGNTRYCGVDIDNAAHLTEALLEAGFARVRAIKRRISNKAATPYRSPEGRFSRARTDNHIYAHEYVLIAHS